MALPTRADARDRDAGASARPRDRGRGRRCPASEGELGVLPGHTPLLTVAEGRGALVPEGRRAQLRGHRPRLRRGAARPGHRAGPDGRAGRGHRRRPRPRRPRSGRSSAWPPAAPRPTSRRAREALARRIDAPSWSHRRPGPDRLSLLMPVQWAATTHPGSVARPTRTAIARGRTWACSSWPTAWAAMSPARSPRDRRRRDRGVHRRDRERRLAGCTWPHPSIRRSGVDGSRLKSAFHLANRRLADEVAAAVDLRGMATTASTVLLKDDHKAMLAHVGDSRIYLFRDNELRAHDPRPLVGRGADARRPAVAARGAPASVAQRRDARAVRRRDPEVDVKAVELQPGDRLLLCSDGLSSVVTDERIEEILRGRSPCRPRRARRSSTRPTAPAAPTTSRRSSCRSMLHNLRQLLRYRGLIQSLVARELKARYRGSVLGFFWSFINPLLLLADLLVRLHGGAARHAPGRRSSRTRCSCSAASCRGRGSRRRCPSRPTC